MSAFDAQAWNDAPVDDGEGGNQEPPGLGDWTVVLADASAFTSKKGDDYVTLSLKVATGPQADYSWDLLFSFKSQAAFKVTKTACSRLGVDVESLTSLQELDARLKEKIGEWLEVAVVESRNPEYPRPSTFINGLVQSQAEAAGFAPRSDVPAETEQFATTLPVARAEAAGVQSGPHTDPDSDIPFAFEPLPAWVAVKGTERAR